MCLILCFYFDFLFPTNCQLYLLFTDLVSYHIVNIFGLQHNASEEQRHNRNGRYTLEYAKQNT